MVVQLPKNSPSLIDLREPTKLPKRIIIPKKKYIVAYDDIAAFKRRNKSDYEVLVCRVTSDMLKEFVECLKSKKCSRKVYVNKDKFRKDDIAQTSLVSPKTCLKFRDNDFSCNTSEISDKIFHKKLHKKTSQKKKEKIGTNEKLNDEQKTTVDVEKTSMKKTPKQVKKLDKVKVLKTTKKTPTEKIPKEKTLPTILKLKKAKAEVQPELFPLFELTDINVDVFFKNGNRYKGRLSCYLMEGEASYQWKDGTIFKGSFIDGTAEGLGHITWSDGSWYDGEIKHNKRDGRGISVLKVDGVPKKCYFGNWKNGKMNGKGMIIHDENSWYDGYWKKGIADGFGLRQYPSGSRYLGEWKNGREHGWGSMTWLNQDVYTGDWVNGKMDGKGTYVWRCIKSDGFVQPMQNVFVGLWKNGKRHGKGSLLLASGAIIHTVWVDGVKDGQGMIICKNGIIIESTELFKDDKVYRFEFPIMVPFWNTWYCEFLNSYRSGLYYKQPLKHCKCSEKKVVEEKQSVRNDCSNNIPVFAPVESLPLWEVVTNAVCQPIPDLKGKITRLIRYKELEILNSEEMWLRKVITNRMADISYLYQHYATISCEKKPTYNAFMFRIMLWQMCRDCGLNETDFSLCELDKKAGYDSYPFGIILMYQMIYYLLILAYELCVKKMLANPKIPGNWGGAFDYFLTNHALPGMQKTTRLPELCNTLPLRNVYYLYDRIGIKSPVNVTAIFKYFFESGDINTLCTNCKPIKMSHKIYGKNKIYPDGRIMFEEKNGTLLETVFDFNEESTKYYDLNDIKYLGRKDFGWNLFQVCPKAMIGNATVFDYEVSYLEFCEFIQISLSKYDNILDPDYDVFISKTTLKCEECNEWVVTREHFETETGKAHKDKEINTESSSTYSDGSKGSTSNCQESYFDETVSGKNTTGQVSSSVNSSPSSSNIIPNTLTSEQNQNFDLLEVPTASDGSSTFDGSQYKDAKTITLKACDSECFCFCHEEMPDSLKGKSPEVKSEGDCENESEVETEEDGSIKKEQVTDVINYLCSIAKGEEGEGENESENFLEEIQNILDCNSDINSTDEIDADLFEMGESEEEEEEEEGQSEENLLAGEDFKLANLEYLSFFKKNNPKESTEMEKLRKKLMHYHCPKFQIKYNKIFSELDIKSMSPTELRQQLESEVADILLQDKRVEDVESDLVKESLNIIKIVAKQRLYEKFVIGQFKNTISQMDSGDYWDNFIKKNKDCNCICKKCISGVCKKLKKKKKFSVEEDEFNVSSDSSLSII